MPDGGRHASILPQQVTASDTIAAIATPPGRGGVAVIRISGDGAFAVARALTRGKPFPERESSRPEVHFRRIYVAGSQNPIDEALILTFHAPHSYTGEDVVEIQCHGGTVTPRRILAACFAAGARLAGRGEFTERAFLNGRMDLSAAEAVIDLIDSKTDRAADEALAGITGAKRQCFQALYDEALMLSTRLEYALDVDESDLPTDFEAVTGQAFEHLRNAIKTAINVAKRGKILREGALVVLAGAPNAGKSSLMNALLDEERAIVSPIAGTTRDSIEESLDLDGWPVRLVDTAGLRESEDVIENEGVRRAENLLRQADVVIAFDREAAAAVGQRAILIRAKADLLTAAELSGETLAISAKTGYGLDILRRRIIAELEKLAGSEKFPSPSERECSLLTEALTVLESVDCADPVLSAGAARLCAESLGQIIGAVYSNDLLDSLFSRFCVGK